MKAKDLVQLILAGLVVVGFFSLLVVLVFVKLPPENKDIMNIVVGGLIGSFATIIGYYFGSSSSASRKDETIGNMLNKSQ